MFEMYTIHMTETMIRFEVVDRLLSHALASEGVNFVGPISWLSPVGVRVSLRRSHA